jgi:hypothetical protein
MRISAILLVALTLTTSARAERLTPADREALLDSLEKLRETVDSKVDSRFKLALAAYREAIVSDETAIAFYLKCTEKLNFTDQGRKPSDFRAWKHDNEEMLSDTAFRVALRCQLQWLILTLRAASDKTDMASLAPEAQSILDGIFTNAKKLRNHQQVLHQAATSTVFARIYEIQPPEKKKWPQSPVQIEAIYEQVIFPTVRGPYNIEKLRAAWIQRIRLEQVRFEEWQLEPKPKGKGGGSDAEAEAMKFRDEVLPELQWQMETDLFTNGDESGAATRMLQHIAKYIDHKSSRNWGQQFQDLLTPPAPSEEQSATQP